MSISRREFLQRGSLVAGAVLLAGTLPREEPIRLEQASALFPFYPELVRPEDQMSLIVGIWPSSFDLIQENGVYLLKARPGTTEVRVAMLAQHVMEWDVSPPKAPSRPVHARWTELRFAVPAGLKFPATTAGILGALRNLPLVTHSIAGSVNQVVRPSAATEFVPAAQLLRAATAPLLDRAAPVNSAYLVDAARRGAARAGTAPAVMYPEGARVSAADGVPFEPATELLVSSRLVISPPGGSTRFTHATEPARQGGPYTEIWGTRLTVLTTDGGRVETPLLTRAARYHEATGGSGTYAADTNPAKLSALTAGAAKSIVEQNTDFDTHIPQQVEDTALHMAHLHLSPRLGASVRLAGDWEGKNVATFRHRTSNGRDTYSRIATAGRLYPLGHKAVRVETVERVFSADGHNGHPAVLRRRSTITVQQRVKSYGSRTWPFTEIELLVDETPEGDSKFPHSDAEYISLNGTPFEFACRGTDKAGNAVDFSMPLIFVPNTFQAADYTALANKYNLTANTVGGLARVFLGHLTVAEPAPSQPDGIVRALGAAEVIAEARIAVTAEKAFKPSVTQFDGRIPALGHLSEQGTSMTFRYAGKYTSFGFEEGNLGEVVLAIDSPLPVTLTDAADAGGLLGTVDPDLTGMSRRLGAVAGSLDTIAGGTTFNPAEYLGQTALAEMKLFGMFPLGALIPATAAFTDAPTITGATIDGLRTQMFTWTMPLLPNNGEVSLAGATLRGLAGSTLRVTSVLEIGQDNRPHQRTECEISNVELAIGLFGVPAVSLPLHHIRFVSVDAQKPTVSVGLGDIEFAGVLGFVNRLASLIGGDGFNNGRASGAKAGSVLGSGPSIDVTPDGVRSSFSLAIPSVAIGMFSLENITFGAALDLPFNGSPRFTFNFGTYDNRFGLFVSALGGGGYLSLGLSVEKGLDMFDGALEFGAQIRIDLKLVEGKVSVMGGVYFKIVDDKTTLTGYLTINGEVSVLSIVTLGVCQTLSLTYSDGKVRGEAELVFYVSTFFFSKTVRRKFSRTFAGSNGDPTFAELMAPQGYAGERPWDIYCKAFS